MENELLTGGTAAAVIAHLLSIAKDRGWIATIGEHRLWAGILSFLTSLGIQVQFDATTGAWLMSGTLTGLLLGVWHAVIQYGAIDALYKQWARIKLARMFDKE